MRLGATRWLIVGLGNPGQRYAQTRHNLGAQLVEALRRDLGQPAFRRVLRTRARVSKGDHLLAIPTTFMNDSGRAVRALARTFRTSPDRLLVVHDDKDLAFGQLKLQVNRSAAGHRGVQSIVDALGTRAFWRLRVGIGAPPRGTGTDDHVLGTFTTSERAALETTVKPRAISTLLAHLGHSSR